MSPQSWQTSSSLGHQQGRREEDGDTTWLVPVELLVFHLYREMWTSGKREWVDMSLLVVPHPTDEEQCPARGWITGYLMPQTGQICWSSVCPHCCHNTLIHKTQKALQEISENQCWWSAFLKQPQRFHIWNLNGCNPDWSWGIPSAFLWKAEVSEVPLPPTEIQSIFYPVFLKEWKHSWISFNKQGWMEPRWYWTGVCIDCWWRTGIGWG